MLKFSEYVSLGHPDKIADYISQKLLDEYIEQDPQTKYAVEVQIKNFRVTLGGEVSSQAKFSPTFIRELVRHAVSEIGYTRDYMAKWGAENTICGDLLEVECLINQQSRDIAQGLSGWKRAKNIPHNDRVIYHSIYIGDKIACFSCLEKFSPRHWGIIMRYRNYDIGINDVCSCMHWLDCAEVHNDAYSSVYLNIGMGGNNKGLCAAKEKLQPCKHLQPYRLSATAKLDSETARRIINECR